LIEEFPAEYVYSVNVEKQMCSRFRIIQKNPIKFDEITVLPFEVCPPIVGFTHEDVGWVMDWIRRAEELANTRCK
jgi:hypothetical protein